MTRNMPQRLMTKAGYDEFIRNGLSMPEVSVRVTLELKMIVSAER